MISRVLPRRRAWQQGFGTIVIKPIAKSSAQMKKDIEEAFRNHHNGMLIINSSEENKPTVHKIEPYIQVVSPIRVFGRPTSTIRK